MKQDESIIGRYYFQYSEMAAGKVLAYVIDDSGSYLTLINPNITALGYDKNYIIVKQTPQFNSEYNSNYNYFIVPIYNELTYRPEEGIMGPMDFNKFKMSKDSLKIRVDFTIIN